MILRVLAFALLVSGTFGHGLMLNEPDQKSHLRLRSTTEQVDDETQMFFKRLLQYEYMQSIATSPTRSPLPPVSSQTPVPTVDEDDATPSPTETVCNGVCFEDTEGFEQGLPINLNTNDDGQLELESAASACNFIWIAASARSTVVKIDTINGTILGEYRTSTDGVAGNPSRTTVDADCSVWVANRNHVPGTVVHIGLEENGDCEDRNNNGIIDTSTGLGDIRGWPNTTGDRGVAFAEDECIVHFVRVTSRGTRHVSIDNENNVWVSGQETRSWDLVKGGRYDINGSGTIIQQYPSTGFGGYGGIFAPSGVIWSAGRRPSDSLFFWNTSLPLTGRNGRPNPDDVGPLLNGTSWGSISRNSYGICLDPFGNVWVTQSAGNVIRKYASNGTLLGGFQHGNNNAQGCVCDRTGDVWVAHSLARATTVGHIANNGTYIGNVQLDGGISPTGVSVDGNGFVWSANRDSNSVSRIDPRLNNGVGAVDMAVPLGAGAGPYNYGDMTGSTLSAAPSSGSWTLTYDGGVVNQVWDCIDWEGVTPSDSQIIVEARTSRNETNFATPLVQIAKRQDPILPAGQFVQVRVRLKRASESDESPLFFGLELLC